MYQKIRHLLFKLRIYGITGAIRALKRFFQRDSPIHEAMLKMASLQKDKPLRGITIIGDMSTHASLPKVLCDLYLKLQLCDIPCQCLDTTQPIDASFQLFKYDHIIYMLHNPLPKKLQRRVKTSAIAFWEFDSGLLEGYPQLTDGNETIAMSDFNYNYYKLVLPSHLVKQILYPFQFPTHPVLSQNATRDKFDIPKDSFVIFFNFGLGSKRKNPEAIIHAFAKAFSASDKVFLVFKTMFSKRFPQCLELLHSLARQYNITNRFKTIDSYLTDDDMLNLTNACDVYISLHRGEGFGLGIAEAMLFSKPVIVTDWSASTEFCNSKTSIPIPYSLVPIDPSEFALLPYNGVKYWAEPDTNAAAAALRRLYNNPGLRKQIGENGRRFIQEHFSLENFKKSIETFLVT